MLTESEAKLRATSPLSEAEIERLLPFAARQAQRLAGDPTLWNGSISASVHPLAITASLERFPAELRALQTEALRRLVIGEVEGGHALVDRIVRAQETLGAEAGPEERRAPGQLRPVEKVPTLRHIALYQKVQNDSDALRGLNRAFEMDKMGKSDQALALYEKVRPEVDKIGSSEVFRVYWNRTGLALHHLGKNVEARGRCLQALVEDPGYGPALYNLAAIELALGDSKGALSLLEKALTRDERFFADLARRDPDFNPLRSDPRFRAMVGMPALPSSFDRPRVEVGIAELRETWPRDHRGDTDPAAFIEKAESLQRAKLAALEALGRAPKPEAVRGLLVLANELHGKRGHTENVVALARVALSDAGFLRSLGPALKIEVSVVRHAAPWLSLAELEIPVRILAVPRRLTEDEALRWLAPRATRSAAMCAELGLGDPATTRAVSEHRGAKVRSLEAQLLDLLDMTAALAAKPSFRRDGAPDPDRVIGALTQVVFKAGLDPRLTDAIAAALRTGLIDRALVATRDADLYVR